MTTDQKRKLLIHYLNLYLSKKELRMKPVIRDIKKRLTDNIFITLRQFNSVIKFLERETELKVFRSREDLRVFFAPLIGKNDSRIDNSYNLEEIFNIKDYK